MGYIPKDGFPYYFDFVKDREVRSVFSLPATFTFLNAINEEQANYRYAPDKWSIKQVLGHITDHERIKMYRAFLLSRNQTVELWDYDQNSLVANSRFEHQTWEQLMIDFQNVRNSSISFIASLSDEQLKIKGKARQYEISLEDFLKSIIGHEVHHVNLLQERYIN